MDVFLPALGAVCCSNKGHPAGKITQLRSRTLAMTPQKDARAAQMSATARFRALHEAGCFVIPNPWDVGTAVFLHVLERLVAFADAGADCLFAPGVREPEEIAEIVKAVAPRPVNVLVAAPSKVLSVPRLATLGVRRVSVGSALARVAWGAFIRAALSIKETGSFDAFADAATFAELDGVFGAPRRAR